MLMIWKSASFIYISFCPRSPSNMLPAAYRDYWTQLSPRGCGLKSVRNWLELQFLLEEAVFTSTFKMWDTKYYKLSFSDLIEQIWFCMQLQYLRKMAELSKKPKFKTEPIPTILTNRKISKTDEDVSNYSEYVQTKCSYLFSGCRLRISIHF